jgi:RNA polymerase-binding transcription factor DksA
MNDNETTITLDELRDQLQAELELLTAQLDQTEDQPGERSATSGHGETEHLKVLEERSVLATIGSLTRTSLEDIRAALDRIEEGTFGRCLGCDGQIPWARLEVMPAASYCVSCQQARE